ncbi:MAG: hypothetical protein ABI442_14865 [Gemmatimonadaceae bacterium]
MTRSRAAVRLDQDKIRMPVAVGLKWRYAGGFGERDDHARQWFAAA